jgi:pimeloyl-ACP methyl ester carboxylesterase
MALTALVSLSAATATEPATGTAKTADGVEITYEVRGKGDTALVFIHGWCGDREFWKHQVEPLSADYRVVTLDLAGHGQSGKHREPWTVTGFAADIEAVAKKLGLKRVILVGHSMGGPIALATAKRLPGVVVGVIGVDTLQDAEYKFPEEQAKAFLAAFEQDFKATWRMGMQGMLPEKADPKLVEWLAAKCDLADQKMAIAVMRDIGQLDEKLLLQEAKVPVRCVNSAGGFMFHTPTAIETNKKYADYKAVLIDDVGHYPMLEKPDEFNAKLREVLKEFGGK